MDAAGVAGAAARLAVAVLLAANGLLHMALLADPLQTTSLILLLVGAGILILSQRWFAVVVLATVGGWVAVASRLPSSPDLAHFGFALMMGAVLALLVQHVHRGHLFRVETLRLRDEERRIELEEAHRTLERRVDDRTRQLREVNSSLQREMAERHEAEEKLRQAHRMEAVGRVAGAVAHDFNNLLTIISGHAELLLQDFAPHDERRLDVDEIREAAGRAARLTRHLLAFGGRQLLRPALLDVNEVARTVLHRTAEDQDPSIRCELDLALDLPPVFVDRGQLEQILLHLLTNAREAMPLGGTLTVATRRREAAPRAGQPAEGGYVLVEVRDTGEGWTR